MGFTPWMVAVLAKLWIYTENLGHSFHISSIWEKFMVSLEDVRLPFRKISHMRKFSMSG
jgi:hypothetical protein